ncbi:MAG: hypothetical protein ACRDD4_00465 [Culicoidibacterales bacterium]
MSVAMVMLGITIVAGASGIGAGGKGAFDTTKAKEMKKETEKILFQARERTEIRKKMLSNTIAQLGRLKVNIAAKELSDFIDLYSKIKNIEIEVGPGFDELNKLSSTENIQFELSEITLKAKKVVTGTAAGLGSGALISWGAYSGVMAMGTASTGTAISGLSGAAATNATLAWLGGGSVASGGGGMAMGTAVLGGMVAGPALLVTGAVVAVQGRTNRNNAEIDLNKAKMIARELEVARTQLAVINKKTTQLIGLLTKLNLKFTGVLKKMKEIVVRENNWQNYTLEEKLIIAQATQYAQIIKKILDMPLLTKDGIITKEVQGVFIDKNILATLVSK